MPTEEQFSTVNFIKDNLGMISAALGVLTIIVTSVIAVESRYANAADVKEMVKNQGEQIRNLNQNNTRALVFQLEYYDTAINRAERELERSQTQKNRTDQSRLIDEKTSKEIQELKFKRDIVKRQIIEQQK